MTEELPNYEIRLMTKEEIPQALEIWRENNLSEGPHFLDMWYEYDPEAFYVAVTDDGTVIGTCAGVLQHADLAFIGLYAVRPTYRRQGIGRQIWDKVMERIGDRNVGMNTVPEMLVKYRDKAGFPIQSDFCSVVCKAQPILVEQMNTDLPGIVVSILTPEDAEMLQSVIQYETDVLGFRRERLLPLLCAERDSLTLVAFEENKDFVCGYGSIRQNMEGNALVGPLFANDENIAELILYHLVKNFPTAKNIGVTIFAVDCNDPAIALLQKLGFVILIETGSLTRLYSKRDVDIQFRKVFGQYSMTFSVF